MKKVTVGIFTILMLLGLGTGVLAATDQIDCNLNNFKQMLPFMKEKHPDLSEKQLNEMHKSCAAKMQKQVKKTDLNN